MTHLAVAKEINDILNIANDLPRYFMGAIAPDSVHFRENYHSDMKKKSHYITGLKPWGTIDSVEECDEWLACVMPKIREKRPHSDYYMGYLIHILTDVWNTRENFIYYGEWCTRENIPKDAYYNEQVHFDVAFYHTAPWRKEIWSHLAKAQGEAVTGISEAEEAEKYRDFVLRACSDGIRKQSYSKTRMTFDDNIEFIKRSADEIARILSEGQFS